ncbi:hypothetical protein OH77DRAFT_57189 [Trametes cingulata]|nr:hypothetical protein OH77DRAFT_57189 [Trametes cingulata]
MEDLRCVHFDDIHAALEAWEPYDDGFMNISLGNLHDHLRTNPSDLADESDAGHFLGLYRAENLLLTLAHAAGEYSWQLACPQNAEHLLTPAFLAVAADLLARTLLPVSRPTAVRHLWGHEGAADAFLNAWAALVLEREGIQLRIGDPVIPGTRASYATRETIPPLPTSRSNILVTQAVEADFEELFPLYYDFRTQTAHPRELHVEQGYLRRGISSGLTWICRIEGTIAGFIVLGRVSPRTIAIRNVYVSPERRRKGIAESLVKAMSRYYLGVRPLGFEGIPDDPPAHGVKDIICINVADRGAERIYRRAGFLFPEQTEDGATVGGRDPVSGLKGWFPATFRGFEAENAPQP